MTIQAQTNDETKVRILLVDDHTLFRRGLSALLSRDPLLQVDRKSVV